MARPASLKKQNSAGGVVFRRSTAGCDVALISVKQGTVWCLPKGIVDTGETAEDAALREVREETGLTGKIVERLGDIAYWYYVKGENTKCRKTVAFYLMEYLSGETVDHDEEVDSAQWFDIDAAITKVNYRGDRSILEKARRVLAGAER